MIPKIIQAQDTITGLTTVNEAIKAPHRDNRDLMRVNIKADKYALKYHNEANLSTDKIQYLTKNEARAIRRRK